MELVTTVASWFTPTTLFLLLNLMIGTLFIASRFGSGPNKHNPPVDPFGSGHAHHHHHHNPLARAPSLIERVKSINFHLYKFPSPETDLFTTHLDVTGSDPHPGTVPLARAPSLLGRVKSINLSYFKFPQYQPENNHAPITRHVDDNPVGSNRVDTIDLSQFKIPEYDEQRIGPGSGLGSAEPVDPPRLARAPSLLERVKSINFSSFYRSDPTHMEQDPVPPLRKSEDDHKPRRSKSETKKPAKKAQKMTKSASEKHAAEETAEAVERRRPETARLERSTSFGDGENSVDAKAADFINKFKHQLKLQRLDSILKYKEMLKAK
ncbi:PREDICTED: uncharacterized protein LOC104811745 [Tarenaya hassleriana]|uniref:uncharacterized protein LOC104811745 n=1 Tax=Tarenaya hassleriana TaxID=28532 RepID=UPI00053CA934|nr:PREDICTED: uncharacterized protein LOC104811745 [Tarenaya hassleriana]